MPIHDLEISGPKGFVSCQVCGRKVSRRSLIFHEPKCLLRWQARQVEKKSGIGSGNNQRRSKPNHPGTLKEEPSCLVPCFVCNRKVSLHSLMFHEPKCLLRWKENNDLLPEKERQNTPTKFAFTLSPGFKLSGSTDSSFGDFASLLSSFTLDSDDFLERPKTQTLSHQTKNILIPVVTEETKMSKENAKYFQKSGKSDQKPVFRNSDHLSDGETELKLETPHLKISSSPDLCNKESVSDMKHVALLESSDQQKQEEPVSSFQYDNSESMDKKSGMLLPGKFTRCEEISNFQSHDRHYFQLSSYNIEQFDCQIQGSSKKSSDLKFVKMKCPRCSTTFPAENLLQHQETCQRSADTFESLQKLASPKYQSKTKVQIKKTAPSTILCNICGRQYGTRSIAIHEPQCLQKWILQNERLPERRVNPSKPPILYKEDGTVDVDTIINLESSNFQSNNSESTDKKSDTFHPGKFTRSTEFVPTNNSKSHDRQCLQLSSYNIEQLDGQVQNFFQKTSDLRFVKMKCPHCSSTFPAENLLQHQETCQRSTDILDCLSSSKHQSKAKVQIKKSAPSTILCNICGRQYGTRSIAIHEPQCLQKWILRNERLPERHADTSKPPILYKEDGTVDLDTMIEADWLNHLAQLVPCLNCGRTFQPDRLPIHQRVCTSGVKNL